MTGGHIGHNLRVQGNGTADWSGGTLGTALFGGRVYLDGNATLNLFGTGLSRTEIKSDEGDGHLYKLSGRLADGSGLDGNLLFINNGSTAHVNLLAPGAAVPHPVHVGYADQDSFEDRTRPTSPTVRLVAGASITRRYSVDVYNHSTLSITGGTVTGQVTALGHSTINVTGGTLAGNLNGNEDSTINVTGGHLTALNLDGSAALNLFGAGLHQTLVDPNYGAGYSQYTLHGTLRDGTRLNGIQLLVVNGGKGRLVLHNDPARLPGP